MQTDTIKVVYTYSIASVIILGGILFLFFVRNDDPTAGQSSTLVPIVTGFIGAALQFVFNRETQTQTAHQVERSTAAGVASVDTGGRTVTP